MRVSAYLVLDSRSQWMDVRQAQEIVASYRHRDGIDSAVEKAWPLERNSPG